MTDSVEVSTGIHTTGEVGSAIVEQALVVETGAGFWSSSPVAPALASWRWYAARMTSSVER